MKTEEVIAAMREWLDEHEWVQNMLYFYDNPGDIPSAACLRGACDLATDQGRVWAHGQREPLQDQVAEILLPVIEELFPGRAVPRKVMQYDDAPGPWGIPLLKGSWVENPCPKPWDKVIGFNDNPETTREDVLLVLKHASESDDGR